MLLLINKKTMPDEQQTTSQSFTSSSSNGQTVESKFKNILYNEVTLVLAIGAFLWGVFNFINNPQQQIQAEFDRHAAIQEQQEQNDEEFQANLLAEFKTMRDGDIKDLIREVDALNVNIAKLETIINERIPRK